jgi:hypothetical protein
MSIERMIVNTLFQRQREIVTLSLVLLAVFVLMSPLFPDKFPRGANLPGIAAALVMTKLTPQGASLRAFPSTSPRGGPPASPFHLSSGT